MTIALVNMAKCNRVQVIFDTRENNKSFGVLNPTLLVYFMPPKHHWICCDQPRKVGQCGFYMTSFLPFFFASSTKCFGEAHICVVHKKKL